MPKIVAVLFAGGASRRMEGRDKAKLTINAKPMWQHVSERLVLSTDQIIVTGNFAPDWLPDLSNAQFVQDIQVDGKAIGPLGGLAAALQNVSLNYPKDSIVVTGPIDAPFFPDDMIQKLVEAVLKGKAAAIARTQERLQPIFGAWTLEVLQQIEKNIDEGQFALHSLVESLNASVVTFTEDEFSSFMNINTPADYENAQKFIARQLEIDPSRPK